MFYRIAEPNSFTTCSRHDLPGGDQVDTLLSWLPPEYLEVWRLYMTDSREVASFKEFSNVYKYGRGATNLYQIESAQQFVRP